MINGPGGSDGLPPRRIDGETGDEGVGEAATDASPPAPGPTKAGRVDSRLGGLVAGSEAGAATGPSASLADRSLAELQPSLDARVASIERFSDLQPLLGYRDFSGPPPLVDQLPNDAKDYLLAGLRGRIQAMPEAEWAAAELAVSIAADRSPVLPERVALRLDSSVRPAYEQSAKLSNYAARVSDLDDVRAVLAQPGVGGPPPLTDQTLKLASRLIGGPQLLRVDRPKPLCRLAGRIADEEFPAEQRDEAFSLVLGAIGNVEFKRHQVEPLADMAECTHSLLEPRRTDGYRAVLQAAMKLWEQSKEAQDEGNAINAADYAHIVTSLALNYRFLMDERGETLSELMDAIELLPEEKQRAQAANAVLLNE